MEDHFSQEHPLSLEAQQQQQQQPNSSTSNPENYLFDSASDLSDLEEQEISDSELQILPDYFPPIPSSPPPQPVEKHYKEYIDDYEGEDLEGSSYKSKKPAKKRKTHAPKVDKDSALILTHIGPEAQERVLEVRKEFNLAMKSITSNKKRAKEADLGEAEGLATDFRNKMREAAERDLVSFTKQKPAVHKLRLLPLVSKQLDRSELQEVFLDHHILDGFQSWLEPLPDGSLPSYDIRLTLFQLLLKLPITTDHLRECRIGPLVVFYTKAPKETTEIKRMAQECVTKWSRPILNISDSYRDAHLEERKVDLNAIKSQQVLPKDSSNAAFTSAKRTEVTLGQRARLPIPNATGYLVRPSNNVTDSDIQRKRSEAYKSLNQTLAGHRTTKRR